MALASTGRERELSRDAIAVMLWPDVPLPNAVHSLRQALHRLGRLLPGLKCHCRDGRSVVFQGAPVSDLAEFCSAIEARDWSRATALYSGPFLGSFNLDEAPAFCHWADGLRRHLERQASDANRRVLESAEDSGDWALAQTAAQALWTIDPTDEESLVVFVNLALRLGRWVEAERALAVARAESEAGSAVASPRFRALEQAVAQARSGTLLPPSPSELPLIGRAKEASYIRATLQDAENASARALVVLGLAGVGKTRLCHNALRVAAIKGCRVISSTARQLASDVSPTVFTDLAGQIQGNPGLEQAFGNNSTRFGATQLSNNSRQVGQLPRELIFSATAEALRSATRVTPLILFVDDAQWIDEASADFLLFAMSRLRDERLMLLLAVRSEDAGATAGVRAILRSTRIAQLRVGDLTPDAAAELVTAFANHVRARIPESIAEQCIKKSGGHPFYLIESLRSWHLASAGAARGRNALPDSIEQLISVRCANLSPPARQVAEALALIGGVVPHGMLNRVAALASEQVADALQELSDKVFVRDSAEGATFVHELVREGIEASIVAARRQVLHRRAARALRAAPPVAIAQVAVHADLGGDRSVAYKYAAAAAADLQRRHGCAEAEPLWRIALRNASSPGQSRTMRERLADCLFNAAKHDEARALYEELLKEPSLSDSHRLLYRGRVLPATSSEHLARSVLVELLEQALSAPDTSEKTQTLIQLLSAIGCNRNIDVAAEYAHRLIGYAFSAPSDPAALFYLNNLSAILAFMGDWSRVDELQTRSVETAQQLSVSWWHACALTMRATTSHLRGRCRASEEDFAKAARIFAAAPGRFEPSMLRLNWGVLLTELAEYDDAAEQLTAVLSLAQDTFRTRHVARAAANLVALYYEAGKSKLALKYAQIARGADVDSEPGYAAIAYGVMGLLATTPAEEKDALAALRDVPYYDQPFGDDFSYAYMFLARMKERQGRWQEAMKLIERGVGMYAGKDFFCHGRLELEKARLLAVVDREAALALAREIRARALEAEAVLLLNKSEALIRQLKREAGSHGRELPAASRSSTQSTVRLAAERSRSRTGMIVR